MSDIITHEAKTVELETPAAVATPEAAPTREKLKGEGWTEKELEAAEKRGMLAKPGEPEKKPEVAPQAAGEPEKEPAKEPEKKPAAKGGLPDFTFKTPEQEKAWLDAFGPGTVQRAMYFRMKNERHARQASEARIRELEAQLKVKPAAEAEPVADPELEDRPLTLKQLKEMREKEAADLAKKNAEINERAQTVHAAQTEQEEYARSLYTDFDDTAAKAKEVIQNLDTMFPEKWKQAKVVQLIRQLQMTAANADRIGLEDYNAAIIAYEIGQMHPEYGKAKVDGEQPAKDTKDKAKLSPEQLKRIEKNTQQRASSASVTSGSGKRSVAAEDVTGEDLLAMDYKKRAAFREKFPDQYAKLMRG